MCPDKLPAMPVLVGDWFKDTGLQTCSLAARGLWFELCLRMWECEERGILAIGNKPWSDRQIAALVAGPEDETLACLDVLLRAGVASRNKNGAIFSRRMVRDEKLRQIRKTAGSKGGFATAKQLATGTAKRIANSETETENEDENEIQKRRGERGEEKPARRVRPRCPIWDAVVAIWFPSELSKGDRSRIGQVVASLKTKGATPDEIRLRKQRHEKQWPKLDEATPESVAKHWDRFGPKARNPLMGEPVKGIGE